MQGRERTVIFRVRGLGTLQVQGARRLLFSANDLLAHSKLLRTSEHFLANSSLNELMQLFKWERSFCLPSVGLEFTSKLFVPLTFEVAIHILSLLVMKLFLHLYHKL